MKTAEQAIHDTLWAALSEKMKVHETRPMTEVEYPFADFEDSSTRFTDTKNCVIPKIEIIVNIWNTEWKRAEVSSVCSELFEMAMRIQDTYGISVSLLPAESSIQILQDTSVKPPLWRGIVTLVFER